MRFSGNVNAIFLLLFIALSGAVVFVNRVTLRDVWEAWQKQDVPKAVTKEQATNGDYQGVRNEEQEVEHQAATATTAPEVFETAIEIPNEMNLVVPFTSQAPHADWELPYQEACEEAAILMAHYYLAGTTIRNADQADEAIVELVDFGKILGYPIDTTLAETADVMRKKWGHTDAQIALTQDVTIDAIKQEIAQGNLVLVPTYGRGLGNPNYTSPGPVYHFLVIKGYTPTHFITNDPGTRKGADYSYPYDTLLNAVHDWNNGDVERGQKVMMIVRE